MNDDCKLFIWNAHTKVGVRVVDGEEFKLTPERAVEVATAMLRAAQDALTMRDRLGQ